MELTKQDKLRLIEFFEFQRDIEASKPLDEMDMGLIDNYVKILLHLQDKHVELSPEFIDEQVRKIFRQEETAAPETAKTTKKAIKFKKIWLIAACLAILLVLFGIISVGNEWDIFDAFKNKFGSVADAPVGVEQTENGISFVKLGKATMYYSIEDALLNEELDILYCKEYPDNIRLKSVNVNTFNSEERIVLSFNDEALNCNIYINQDIPEDIKSDCAEIVKINNIQCYIAELDDVNIVQIHFKYNNNTYRFVYNNKQKLLDIIKNLEESE